MNDYDFKRWECPECGRQYLSPTSWYSAVCSCPDRQACSYFPFGGKTGIFPPFDFVLMREIPLGTAPLTPQHPYRLVAVPWAPDEGATS